MKQALSCEGKEQMLYLQKVQQKEEYVLHNIIYMNSVNTFLLLE